MNSVPSQASSNVETGESESAKMSQWNPRESGDVTPAVEFDGFGEGGRRHSPRDAGGL